MDIKLLYKDPDEQGKNEPSFSPQTYPIILLNIPGQTYTFGHFFPGERENEEFIFSRNKKYVEPIQCHISVRENGEFWISNGQEGSQTYLNYKQTKKPMLLKIGDSVSFGVQKTFGEDFIPGPVFLVQKRRLNRSTKNEEYEQQEISGDNNSAIFSNSLAFSEILSYLSYKDVKSCRLVCKSLSEIAAKVLEERSSVTFNFGRIYAQPEESTKVFRFLSEVKEMKIRQLQILLSPTSQSDIKLNIKRNADAEDWKIGDVKEEKFGQYPMKTSAGEPGSKMLLDLRKLLKSSQNFLSLRIFGEITNQTDFSIFTEILQNLGENLQDLRLFLNVKYFPDETPAKLPISWVKSFSHTFPRPLDQLEVETSEQFVCFLAPSLSRRLVKFHCDRGFYLREFVDNPSQKLQDITLQRATADDLRLLLLLQNPLKILRLKDVEDIFEPEEVYSILQNVLNRNAKTLECLQLMFNNTRRPVFIKFPRFPNLKSLDLKYTPQLKVIWESPNLDYRRQFPLLRNLALKPSRQRFKVIEYQWEDPQDLFNSFFPRETETSQVVNSVKTVKLRALEIHSESDWEEYVRNASDETLVSKKSFEAYQIRKEKIGRMFPNSVITERMKGDIVDEDDDD